MTIEDVADALVTKNFIPCKPQNAGAYCFTGDILCNGETVPVEIEIDDMDFIVSPAIRILRRPKSLRGFQPHFGMNDKLCYLNDGAVFLDRYNPAGVVCSCLDKASQVLSKISSKNFIDDTHEEFTSYWYGEKLYIDSPPDFQGLLSSVVVTTANDKSFLLVSNDILKKTNELKSIGLNCEYIIKDSGYLLKSELAPAVTGDDWPPQTIKEVMNWVRNYDTSLYNKIYRHMASTWVANKPRPFFIIRTTAGDIGFRLNINELYRKKLGNRPSSLRNYLLNSGSKSLVDRYIGKQIDNSYIHSRNIPSEKNLRDKKILIIGCGTVGGYLSTYAARLGAGLGSKGKLILCDIDTLDAANLGRHVLGMYALMENKANAVKDEIMREFPHLHIESRDTDARHIKDLYNVDIVVDATGEEVLSMALNDMFTQRRIASKETPDVLHVWTRSSGKFSQSLLIDSLKTACYSCLYIRRPSGEVDERYPIDKKETRKSSYETIGCEGYMPFPVSASVQAASLGINVLLDWVRGDSSPRFRTASNHSLSSKNTNKDPSTLPSCPACQKT